MYIYALNPVKKLAKVVIFYNSYKYFPIKLDFLQKNLHNLFFCRTFARFFEKSK